MRHAVRIEPELDYLGSRRLVVHFIDSVVQEELGFTLVRVLFDRGERSTDDYLVIASFNNH
jgi:hypothetical protein